MRYAVGRVQLLETQIVEDPTGQRVAIGFPVVGVEVGVRRVTAPADQIANGGVLNALGLNPAAEHEVNQPRLADID